MITLPEKKLAQTDAPISATITLVVVATSESATGAHIAGTTWKAAIPLRPEGLRRRELGD